MDETLDKAAIGARIHKARNGAGYTTIHKFAVALDVNYTQIVRWEKGYCLPPTKALDAIATLCDVSVDHLLGRM